MLSKRQLTAVRKFFSRQPDVVAAYIFGSQARGDATVKSDVDIALVIDKKATKKPHLNDSWAGRAVNLGGDLSSVIGKKVESQELTAASPRFAHRVLREGIRIYQRSAGQTALVQEKIMRRYFDLVPFYREYDQKLIDRINSGQFAALEAES